MVHPLLRRPANALNPTKAQVTAKFMGTGKAIGPNDMIGDDKVQRQHEVLHNKRERWHNEARDQIPPERIYQVIGEVPKTKDVPGAGGGAQVGVSNTYVTQSGNSKITWNPVTKRWEYASYSQNSPTLNKLVRIVSSGQRGNRQSGGSY